MKPLAVLRNDAAVPPGYLAAALDGADRAWQLVRLDTGDPIPPVDDVGGVVVLGGHMGAYDEGAYPYLADEKQLLADAVDASVPVLGICLGAQLLADALGGWAYLAEAPEAVFDPIDLTEDGVADLVTRTLEGRTVLSLHQDTWELPPGATSLARGRGFEQAFRLGSGLGVQPHTETDPEIVADWLSQDAGRELVWRAGRDPDELLWAFAAARAESEETAARFFDAWLAEIAR